MPGSWTANNRAEQKGDRQASRRAGGHLGGCSQAGWGKRAPFKDPHLLRPALGNGAVTCEHLVRTRVCQAPYQLVDRPTLWLRGGRLVSWSRPPGQSRTSRFGWPSSRLWAPSRRARRSASASQKRAEIWTATHGVLPNLASVGVPLPCWGSEGRPM